MDVAKAAAECVKSLRWLATGNFNIEDARREMLAAANIIEAEHPADSDLPLTEEWLRSVGFDERDGDLILEGNQFDIRWDGCLFLCHDEPEGIMLEGRHTRGDVRNLARALGIEIKGE